MAVPVIASWTKTQAAVGGALTCTAPSGISADDLLVVIACSDQAAAVNSPDIIFDGDPGPGGGTSPEYGFTKLGEEIGLGGQGGVGVFWKHADGTEGNIQVEQANSYDLIVWYLRITGVDFSDSPEAPIEVVTWSSNDSGGTSHTVSGVTTTSDDCLVIYALAQEYGSSDSPYTGYEEFTINSADSPTPWTEVDESATGGLETTRMAACFGSRSLATAGSSGDLTVSSGRSSYTTQVQFAVKSQAGSTAVTSGLAALSFTPYASTVQADVDTNVTSTLGALSFTAYASTVSQDSTTAVASGLAAMSLTPYASSVVQGTQYAYSFALGSVLQYEVTAVDDFSMSGVQHSRVTRSLKNRRFELVHAGLTAQEFADIKAIYDAQDTRTIYYMNRWFGCRMDEPPQVVENHGNNKVTIKVIMRGSPL